MRSLSARLSDLEGEISGLKNLTISSPKQSTQTKLPTAPVKDDDELDLFGSDDVSRVDS